MRQGLIALIHAYQKYLSPDTGVFRSGKRKTCVFFPSCSEYTIQALEKYGVLRGCYMGVRRILRCHPWQKNHIDPLV
jgi:putative membrane protein insertion efficiency factor